MIGPGSDKKGIKVSKTWGEFLTIQKNVSCVQTKQLKLTKESQLLKPQNPTKAHTNTLILITIESFWLFFLKNVFFFKSNKLDSCNFGYLVEWKDIKCDKILEEISKGCSLLQLSVSLSAFLVGKFSPIVFLSMALSKGTRGMSQSWKLL